MEATVEQKLKALYKLQTVDSEIDKLAAMRGELPLEVSDLEDEVAGMETRLEHLNNDIQELENQISFNKISIKDSQALIKKYEGQLNNVKNNREYDALNKEVELQNLEIQASEKRIKDFQGEVKYKNELLGKLKEDIEGRKVDLVNKKKELDNIVEDTEKEEKDLLKQREKASSVIEERLMTAYLRIRNNVVNGIGVAKIDRDSCNGCFASIPPQRQIDIKQRKKIIVCESCGRILVDGEMADEITGVTVA
jgi:predicted  nucleic acid-binding Zn-ribbon protein